MAKSKLIVDELAKRRRLNACINCGEVGHTFFDCPKPKTRLLESVIDSIVPITRTPFSELFSAIDESCVIKINSDYRIDSIEHRLNDAIELNREIESSQRCGLDIDTSLTNIDSALSPNLRTFSKNNSHSFLESDSERKLKRIVTIKFLSRRKRPPTDGWRL
jgi:hypothetical protein